MSTSNLKHLENIKENIHKSEHLSEEELERIKNLHARQQKVCTPLHGDNRTIC